MSTIYLAWVSDSPHESEPEVARKSEEGAKRWCNEHRKSEGGAPLTWKRFNGVGQWAREPGVFAVSVRKGEPNLHYEVHGFPYEDE